MPVTHGSLERQPGAITREERAMTRWIRRSLLLQMIGVYLVFALVVLGAGLAVNALVEHQLRDQV